MKLYSNNIKNNESQFYKYLRMPETTFDELLQVIQSDIQYLDTNLRVSVSPEERLVITLRYVRKIIHYHIFHTDCLKYYINKTLLCIFLTTCSIFFFQRPSYLWFTIINVYLFGNFRHGDLSNHIIIISLIVVISK